MTTPVVVAAWVVLLLVAPLLIVAAVGVLVLTQRERFDESCDCEQWRPTNREIADAVAEWEASQ